mgnify:FL=1
MENEKNQTQQAEGGFNGAATPSDKMMGDLSVLKDVSNISELSQEEKAKTEEQVKNVADSIVSGGKIDASKLSENKDVLKQMSDKGFSKATETLAQMDEVARQTTGKGIDELMQNPSSLEQVSQGQGAEFAQVAQAPQEREGVQAPAPQEAKAPQVAPAQAQKPQGHLKETLASLANYDESKAQEDTRAPAQKQEESAMSVFMEQKYAANSRDRLKFNIQGPEESNEGRTR